MPSMCHNAAIVAAAHTIALQSSMSEASASSAAIVAAETSNAANKRRRVDGAPRQPLVPSADTSVLDIACRPATYAQELTVKVESVRSAFAAASIALPAHIDEFASAHEHFRQRAEFGVWHNGDEVQFVMHTKASAGARLPVRVDSFPIGSARINALMPRVLAFVNAPERRSIMCAQLFEVKFLTTLSGEALCTLIYHRPLLPADGDQGAAWKAEALKMCTELDLVGVCGRSRNVKLVVGRGDYVIERLAVPARGQLEYKQSEELFGQSNGGIAAQMLGWAYDVCAALPEARNTDLLELYCGSGAFTVALAPCFRRVLATELSKPAIDVAHENMARNHVDNVALGRVSAEDFRLALEGARPYQRLAHVDLGSYALRTVFVDPPRAGCGADVSPFLARFDRIVYISCNPHTMVEDIKRLEATHKVARFAVFDQFAYTPHIEAGALLVRRD